MGDSRRFLRAMHPDDDSDRDGVSDALEAIAGTDSNDGNDYFRVESATRRDDGGVVLSWAGVAGKTYAVEFSSTLAPGSWQEIASGLGDGAYEDNDAARLGDAAGYYRVKVE